MKYVFRLILISFFLFTIGCSSLGTTHLSDGHVTVKIGDNIKSDKRKFKHLRAQKGVEVLHRYVVHRFKKRRVRKSLKVTISINDYRVGYGSDHMGADVGVTENGTQLKEFSVFQSMGRFAIKRMSKLLAKQIYLQIRSL